MLYGTVAAQAWNPFPNGATYLYTFQHMASSDTWLHGIKTDSVGTIGQDSVYYFNRINRYFEMSETANGCYGPIDVSMQAIALGRQNYFGEYMLLRANGDYDFVTTAQDTFRIRTQVSPGSSWIFTPGDTATLDSIRAAVVLGVPDSIQYIRTTSGNNIHLSKQHGFVRTFSFLPFVNPAQTYETVAYQIWGIPHENLGDTLPGAQGVFDYDIGDRRGFRREYKPYGSSYVSIRLSNTETSGRTPQSNGVQYNTIGDRIEITTTPYVGTDSVYFPPSAGTSTINFSDFEFLDLLPYQSGSPTVQIGMRIFPAWNNRIVAHYENIIYYDSCANALTRFEDQTELRYATGLGRTYFYFTSPFYYEKVNLTCYVKQTDSAGTCLDLGTLIGVEDALPETVQLNLFPQPAGNVLGIRLEGHSHLSTASLTLYSMKGALIAEVPLQEGQTEATISTENFADGIYLLRYQQKEGGAASKKILIQH